MQPILFAGYPLGSSLGLVTAFEWLGQPYRLTRVQMPDDMVGVAFARLNGRRETPLMVRENGLPLTETLAIAQWLIARDERRRISFAPGTDEAFRLQQYMAFLNTGFTGAFSPLWAALEMPDASEVMRESLRSFGRASVAKRHAQLESMLGDSPYMLGAQPTLADAIFVGVARWADFHQAIDAGAFPKVEALKERLSANAAVRFAEAIETEGQPSPGLHAMSAMLPLDTVLELAVPSH